MNLRGAGRVVATVQAACKSRVVCDTSCGGSPTCANWAVGPPRPAGGATARSGSDHHAAAAAAAAEGTSRSACTLLAVPQL